MPQIRNYDLPTYLFTRAKCRDASASKNEGVAQCANTKKGVETSRDRAGTIFIACLSACLAQRSPWGEVSDWVRWVGWGVEVEGSVCYAWGSEQLVIAFAFFTATAPDLTT